MRTGEEKKENSEELPLATHTQGSPVPSTDH